MTRFVPHLCGAATIGILLLIMGRNYPLIGHDFAYFVPRLIDTDLHLRINGAAVQWYTPSFGGGLPAFANPQHLQYSLVQALLFVSSPWLAILASTAAAAAIGYLAMYRFLSRVARLSTAASVLGAVGLIANGFYIEHLTVGHVGFQLFPLVAVMLYAVTRKTRSPLEDGCVIALCVALMIHQGGAFILILSAGTLVLALQLAHAVGHPGIGWRRMLTVSAWTAILTLGLCGSKVFAVQALMSHFPRVLSDSYSIGIGHGLFGLGSQLAGGMIILPILLAGGFPPQRLDDALIRATGAGVHVWEIDTGLSPVVAFALLGGAVYWIRSLSRGRIRRPSLRTALCIAGLLLTTWFTIETTLARGVIYPVVRELPVFRSLHINHRVAAVFILPLTIAAACLFDKWQAAARKPLVYGALAVAVGSPLFYLVLPEHVHRRNFDITSANHLHERVRAGESFPVRSVQQVDDADAIVANASSITTYEPLFGYDSDYFAPKVVEGPVDVERNGALNLTNPSSLIFPELNGLRPFDLVRADDRANLVAFAARRQPDWKRPQLLDWLNVIAVGTLAGCLGIIVAGLVRGRKQPHPSPP
jgi:hypothetical protein